MLTCQTDWRGRSAAPSPCRRSGGQGVGSWGAVGVLVGLRGRLSVSDPPWPVSCARPLLRQHLCRPSARRAPTRWASCREWVEAGWQPGVHVGRRGHGRSARAGAPGQGLAVVPGFGQLCHLNLQASLMDERLDLVDRDGEEGTLRARVAFEKDTRCPRPPLDSAQSQTLRRAGTRSLGVRCLGSAVAARLASRRIRASYPPLRGDLCGPDGATPTPRPRD
jgi:hypothetical protein